MSERRNKRIEEVLKEELSKIINKEADLPPSILITLTRAEISSDSKYAKVWISVLPEKDRAQAMAQLKKQLPFFQYLLVKKMNMKWVPEISFIEDATEEEAGRIEEIISGNKLPRNKTQDTKISKYNSQIPTKSQTPIINY